LNTTPVVLALHYQNDVLHPDGRIRVGLGDQDPAREALIAAAGRLLAGARADGWAIIHVRIAFRPDYADLARNTPIFRRTEEIGAVRDGEWGAGLFDTLAPVESKREFVVKHTRISAFYGTQLEQLLQLLGARTLIVAGVATHSVVESTVRDAADRGFDVWVAADACAAADRNVHLASLASMGLIATVTEADRALEKFRGEACT
jgi:nicotinamidase-related amidase